MQIRSIPVSNIKGYLYMTFSYSYFAFGFRFGRKPTCILTFAGTLGCMFAITFTHSVELYMIFRAGSAMFSYSSAIATFVYSKQTKALLGFNVKCIISRLFLIIMQ